MAALLGSLACGAPRNWNCSVLILPLPLAAGHLVFQHLNIALLVENERI
jgi:hypothetical protein